MNNDYDFLYKLLLIGGMLIIINRTIERKKERYFFQRSK